MDNLKRNYYNDFRVWWFLMNDNGYDSVAVGFFIVSRSNLNGIVHDQPYHFLFIEFCFPSGHELKDSQPEENEFESDVEGFDILVLTEGLDALILEEENLRF